MCDVVYKWLSMRSVVNVEFMGNKYRLMFEKISFQSRCSVIYLEVCINIEGKKFFQKFVFI